MVLTNEGSEYGSLLFSHTKREENKFNQTKQNDEIVFMIHKDRHLFIDYNKFSSDLFD